MVQPVRQARTEKMEQLEYPENSVRTVWTVKKAYPETMAMTDPMVPAVKTEVPEVTVSWAAMVRTVPFPRTRQPSRRPSR